MELTATARHINIFLWLYFQFPTKYLTLTVMKSTSFVFTCKSWITTKTSRRRDRWKDLKSHRSHHSSSYWGGPGRAWSTHHSARVAWLSRAPGTVSPWAARLRLGTAGTECQACEEEHPYADVRLGSSGKKLGKGSLQIQEYSHLGRVSPCQVWQNRTVTRKGENALVSWLAPAQQKKTSEPNRNRWGSDIGESNSPYFQRASRRGRKQGTVITRKVREIVKRRRKLFLYYSQNWTQAVINLGGRCPGIERKNTSSITSIRKGNIRTG